MPKRLSGYSFLDVAAVILSDAQMPLSVPEIIDEANRRNILNSQAATPKKTMYGALSRDIRKYGETSRFRKVGPGRFMVAADEA